MKLCINKDNPLVPKQSATSISACLSGLNSKLVGFYQENGFLFTPDLYIGGQILKRIIFVFSKRNEYEYG